MSATVGDEGFAGRVSRVRTKMAERVATSLGVRE